MLFARITLFGLLQLFDFISKYLDVFYVLCVVTLLLDCMAQAYLNRTHHFKLCHSKWSRNPMHIECTLVRGIFPTGPLLSELN